MTDDNITPAGASFDEDEGGSFIKALPSILWQRRWLIAIPTVICAILGVAAAFLIKPVYRSEATLVIESQQLPADLVASPVNDMVEERIARVRQRVLSRPDLIQLIRQNNLYPEDSEQPLSKIIEKMRKATDIEAIGANTTSSGWRGGTNSNTIAFDISFDYSEPAAAQLVVQQYVNSFLDLDAKSRSEDAAGAATFLGDQAASIQRQIQDVEGQISQIRSQNGAVLAFQGKDTSDPVSSAAQIDGEIAGLISQNSQLAATPAPDDTDPDVKSAEQALRSLKAKFADTHPDVVAAEAQLAAAKEAAAKKPKQPNPVTAEMKANNAKIAALRNAKSMILSQGSAAKALSAQAPAVAGRIDALEQKAQGLRDQYAGVATKLQNAQVSSRMESENKGERLSVADPPVIPDTPSWPNRPVVIIGGIVAGLAIGLGLSLLIELLFRPVRGTESLRLATGRPPLVVIPLLDRKPGLLVRLLERLSRRRLARRPSTAA